MANEVQLDAQPGQTYYFQRRRVIAGVVSYWSTVGLAFEAYNGANWANYDHALAEGAPGQFSGSASGGSAGDETLVFYTQIGGAPATSDQLAGSAAAYWDGAAYASSSLPAVDGLPLADALKALMATLLGKAQPHVVQTVTILGAPTGGTFALVYSGQMTAALAHNASAATVQAALEALSKIGVGNVTVTGSAGGPYTVTLGGTLDLTALSKLGAANLLAGGASPLISIGTTVRYKARDGVTTAVTISYAPTDGSRTGSTIP